MHASGCRLGAGALGSCRRPDASSMLLPLAGSLPTCLPADPAPPPPPPHPSRPCPFRADPATGDVHHHTTQTGEAGAGEPAGAAAAARRPLQHCGIHALRAAGCCLLPFAIAQSEARRRLTPLFPLSACPCRRCRRPGLARLEEQDSGHQGAQGEAGGRAFSDLPMSHLAEKGCEACPPKPRSRVSCCGTPATQEGSAAVVQQQGRFLNSCPSPLVGEYH